MTSYDIWLRGVGIDGIRVPISEDVFKLIESSDKGVIISYLNFRVGFLTFRAFLATRVFGLKSVTCAQY